MPIQRIDEYTYKATVGKLEATVRTSDQYVTVYCNEKPMGTLIRARVLDRNKAEWSVFDLDGRKLGEHNMVSPLLHIMRRDLLAEA